jgi:acetolactate synthase-1/2/3 large subunit
MPSCGEAVIELVRRSGATTVFGIPGVHTLELYRGLGASGLRHVAPRHEQGAAFMADGWARVTGRPGVCVLIGGPGLTNAITPIAQAYHDSVPMLVISGAVPAAQRHLGEIHDLPDQRALLNQVTAFSHTVENPDELPEVFTRAEHVFRSERPRPVHIAIPVDVLKRQASLPDWSPPAPDRPRAEPADVARAAELLAGAARPLVLLGGGARDAGPEALVLARALDAPVGLTINARGTIPDADPLCLGSALSFPPVSDLLREADATLLVGAQFSDLELWGLSEPLTLRGLVRVDIDAEQLGRRWTPAVSLHGDAAATLHALADALPPDVAGSNGSGAGIGATAVRAARAALTPPPEVARFQPLLEVLDRVLPRDRIIAGDSTQPVYAANHVLPMDTPRSWLMPIGYGCLGCALPMALGAKLAAPERPVLALAGDGGFQFTIQELATARDLGLPVIILVYDNRGYGEIRLAMDDAGVGHLGTDASTHDLLQIAEGFGVPAVRSASLSELEGQLAGALTAGGPTVIEYAETQR